MIFICYSDKYRKITPSEYLFTLWVSLFEMKRESYPENCIVKVPCEDGLFEVELSSGYPCAVKVFDAFDNLQMIISSSFESKILQEFLPNHEIIRSN